MIESSGDRFDYDNTSFLENLHFFHHPLHLLKELIWINVSVVSWKIQPLMLSISSPAVAVIFTLAERTGS